VIEELHIRGLGVIEDSSLLLGPGLTVVTGETGAGKTMLVTALQLLLGARASTDLVRHGLDAAVVEAVVRVPPGSAADASEPGRSGPEKSDDGDDEVAQAPAADAGDEAAVAALWALAEDGVLIVSREIPASGRSRARVAGRLVPPSMLGALLGPLIEVHGQHEHVRLEQPAVQRRLLDSYGGHDHALVLDAYRSAYGTWVAAARRERMLREDAASRARRLDQLRAERDEIDAAALDPERDGSIDQDIDRLANADALRGALDAARDAAGPSGALEGIGTALAALRRAPVDDAVVNELADRLGALSRDLSETVADLAAFAADVESDDARLDALQVRKRQVTALLRRFGASVESVLDHREVIAVEIRDLEELEDDATGVVAAVEMARVELEAVGLRLMQARRQVGDRLSTAVREHLAELGLEHASIIVAVEEVSTPGPEGADRVDLLLAANPGEPPARLADAASGGERSRVALALEVVLSADRGRGVLVFDEVDAGIGGSTALAVGEKLARLADHGASALQVLCVTHLAQVAAFADAHHLVEKNVRNGRTVTSVRRVEDQERAAVLSRMLGGEVTAGAGMEHARGLLEAARARRDH
jgi:DNA repair protein RecN (Recombination protein N)